MTSGHIIADFCGKPNRFTRRIGSTWQCDCGELWSLQKEGPYGTTRTWVRVIVKQHQGETKLGRKR